MSSATTLIDQPGIYDLPASVYHADPCPAPSLSSGIGRLLLHRSPRHAWFAHARLNPWREPSEPSEVMDRGSIIHRLVLGAGADIVEVDADSWRTKAAQQARDDARDNGAIPILSHKLPALERIAAALREQLDQHTEAADMFTQGRPEQALIWQEPNGIWCRALLDWMPDNPAGFIDDLKTTAGSAAPRDWERNLQREYAFQAAFYMRGSRIVRGVQPAGMRFAALECEVPHGCCVLQPAPSLLEVAQAEVERAIRVWAHCLETNHWPGYPNRTCHVEATGWIIEREAEQAMMENAA